MRILLGLAALGVAITPALAQPDNQETEPVAASPAGDVQVDEVSFRSTDGRSTVKGYLFRPAAPAGRAAAIVMLHGRGGAYSSLATASTTPPRCRDATAHGGSCGRVTAISP